ncbi:NAD-dependent epimerase/dehydratase family protein [Paucilactobacillus kaifaensis]|uniref:NAD-dependent epimerase/dehydratase family protein n=1 Tax=Paucilactobacillus kaifaensis TaxID=2559921 RepID=UPI0010F6DB58|nr:NAD-dependent epimerase/dehydratase family protein [Paucilactobacillus kaifaensis]
MKAKVLVTGGNGFLAMHIIKQLLDDAYPVRATVRSIEKQTNVITALQNANTANLDQLSFIEASLTEDANWPTAMKDITYVMSVAAPVFVNGTNDPQTVTQTATQGTLRILKAAVNANVKRVIMTSNLGAVGFSNLDATHVTTEVDWTDSEQPGLSLYEKSKLVAEKSAWEYLKRTDSKLEFVTVNPGAMLGPALDQHVSGSFGLVKNLLDGTFSRIPRIEMNIVDVRDVADMHVRAMMTPQAAGKRFLAVNDVPVSMGGIATVIRLNRPELAAKVPTKLLSGWLIKLASHFNQQAKEGRLFLEINHNVSNQQAKSVLGWHPIYSNEQTILSAVDQLVKSGEIK